MNLKQCLLDKLKNLWKNRGIVFKAKETGVDNLLFLLKKRVKVYLWNNQMEMNLTVPTSSSKSHIVKKTLDYLLKTGALFLIGIYRSIFTATFGAGVCRFYPSCSEYANQAFLNHSFCRAFKITFLRIIRCRPGSDFGYDPVPPFSKKEGHCSLMGDWGRYFSCHLFVVLSLRWGKVRFLQSWVHWLSPFYPRGKQLRRKGGSCEE